MDIANTNHTLMIFIHFLQFLRYFLFNLLTSVLYLAHVRCSYSRRLRRVWFKLQRFPLWHQRSILRCLTLLISQSWSYSSSFLRLNFNSIGSLDLRELFFLCDCMSSLMGLIDMWSSIVDCSVWLSLITNGWHRPLVWVIDLFWALTFVRGSHLMWKAH